MTLRPAAKTALTTLLIGMVWIWASDYYYHLSHHPETPFSDELMPSVKGSFFVLAISVVVYLLIRRSQRNLSRNAKTFRTLFVGNPVPMLICEPDTLQILDVNEATCELYEYRKSDLLKLKLSDLREDSADHSNLLQTERHLSSSNKKIFVELRSSQTIHEGKESLIIAAYDVTERQEIKNALLQRERLLDSLLLSERSYLIRVDLEGYYAFANELFKKDFAHISKDFVGVHFLQTVHPDDVEVCTIAAQKSIDNPGEIISVEMRKPGKTPGEFVRTSWEFMATLNEENEISGVQAVGVNSSQLEKVKKEGQKSQAQLAFILDTIIDGFILMDNDLIIEQCNQIFADLVESQVDDILGKSLTQVLPGYENTRSSVEIPIALKERKSRAFEAYNPFFDKWFSVSLYPYNNGIALFSRDMTEQKKRDLEIHTNEINLRSIINTTQDFIWSIDTDFRLLTANTPCVDWMSLQLQRPVKRGDSIIDVGPSDSLNSVFKSMYDECLRGTHVEKQIDMNKWSDYSNLLEVRISPIRDEENNILGAACFARDISERELQRAALIRAIERFDILSEVTQDAIWDLNPSTNFISWSKGLSTTFGYEVESTDLDWWSQYVHPEDVQMATRSLDECIKGSERSWACEYRFLHANGTYRWVLDRGIVLRDEDGNPTRMMGSMQDITPLKESQDEIEKLSHVAKHTSTGVVVTDAEGTIEWCNEAFLKLTGYTLSELIGQVPGDLLQGEETSKQTVEIVSQAIKDKTDVTVEILNYNKAGRKYWIRMAITPIFDGDKLKRFIAIETDISEEKHVQERLFIQNKNLREIAFTLSHDLRKPVSSILGLLQLYDKDNPGASMNNDVIKYLFTATKELDNMIHEIVKQTALIDE